MGLGADDIVLTVATDGAAMYRSEIEIARAARFAGEFSEIEAAEAFGQYLLGAGIDHVSELTPLRPRTDLQSRLLHLGRAGKVRTLRNSICGATRASGTD